MAAEGAECSHCASVQLYMDSVPVELRNTGLLSEGAGG